MRKPLAAAIFALGASLVARPTYAADEVMVVCANNPSHADCGKTDHYKVDNEEEGIAAFREMRGKLYSPADPVAQALARSKYGNPDGFKDLITEAFFYPVDKARCVYAEAERVFYGEESGPIEDGTNENTARAALFYLNNMTPGSLSFKDGGMYHGDNRLFLSKGAQDAEQLKKDWAAVFAQHCKGK